MDAGARGRRLLQRREYRAKVSDFIPKELEDQYTPNGELVFELDIKKTAEKVVDKIKRGAKKIFSGPIMKPNITKDQHLQKIRNSGGDPSHWANSYEPEGEMLEANSAQMKAMHDAKVKKMEDDKVASKKKGMKEGTKYGLYKGSGKASGSFKDYLDKKKKEKKKVEEGKEEGGYISNAAKAEVRNQRRFGKKGSAEPTGRFGQGTSEKAKLAVKRGEEHKARRGVKTKGVKEEVELEAKKSCGEGEYYCHDMKKCKPIPDGMKVGKDGMLVKEDMKGMSQKSGDKRSTESGAGMTAQGVAKYNRRTGGNLKTAVTTPPSKLKAGSKAAKRRKSFCARSKSWTGPRGKAARRRWNCSYEPELPMIIDEKKKLFNSAPLSDRVAAWSKKINEGSLVRGNYGPYISGQTTKKEKKVKIDPNKLPVAERKMTEHEKDKKEKYVKGMKKDRGGFTKRYGKDGKSVMYATATKMAMKEVFGGIPGDGYLGHPNLNIKNPFAKKQIKEPVLPKAKPGSGGLINRVGAQMGDYNMQIQKLMQQNSFNPDGEMTEDFYRKKYTVKDGYKKTDKMTKSNKRAGDSKAQYRELHKDLRKYKLKKLKTEGSLHSWFKGSKSKDGKPGWVNVVTGGTCASDKKGEGTPKCVSSSKRASMSKAERLSASRRKKKADPGQQSKSGAAKPTYVATDSKKKK